MCKKLLFLFLIVGLSTINIGSDFKQPSVSDHGTLTGLADDDHTQYQKETDFTEGSLLFRGTSVIDQDNANLFWDNSNKRLGIGTTSPQAPLEVGGTPGFSVGGFPSGNLHVTGQSALVNANSVITGHNLNGGNKQLWYLGSTSSSNDNVGFINRQNGSMTFRTNNTTRMTIANGGTITFPNSVSIDGSANEVQFTVEGHSTQTANLFELKNSAGSVRFAINNNGDVVNFSGSGTFVRLAGGELKLSNAGGIVFMQNGSSINNSGIQLANNGNNGTIGIKPSNSGETASFSRVSFEHNTREVYTPQTETCADTGDANPCVLTLTPTSGQVQITCNDVNTCDITLSETGAVDGQVVTIYNVSANIVDFTDTAGVTELAGDFAAGQNDALVLNYISTTWAESSRSNN